MRCIHLKECTKRPITATTGVNEWTATTLDRDESARVEPEKESDNNKEEEEEVERVRWSGSWGLEGCENGRDSFVSTAVLSANEMSSD